MGRLLRASVEAILWPLGVRRKRPASSKTARTAGARGRDDGDHHAGPPDEEVAVDEDESWEVDHVHFLGVMTGAFLAYWAFKAKGATESSRSTIATPGSGAGVASVAVAAAIGIPRIPLSDFLVLLRAGAVTAVTYLGGTPPAGLLVMSLATQKVVQAASPGSTSRPPLSPAIGSALLALPSAVSPAACAAGGAAATAGASSLSGVAGVTSAASSAAAATMVAETLLMPGCHQGLFEELRARDGLVFECAELAAQAQETGHLSILVDIIGLLCSLGVLWYFCGGSNASGSTFTGKHLEDSAKASNVDSRVGVTMADVAGMDDVKEELGEVIAFLRDPKSFYALGARTPRGILLTGPSGTGKTLLARAVAGEAGVPFLYASSPSFVEIFVGQGAQRIRQFFEEARHCAPCIVFFDELDAVGAARTMAAAGGNQEHAQTLNQLLLELDGIETHSSAGNPVVVTMAATNRYDCLDEALVRPGRFDRIVLVGLPNFDERRACLQIHARKLRSDGLDFDDIARRTNGKSGAELGGLLNEAGLLAARRRADAVRMEHVNEVMRQPRLQQKRPHRVGGLSNNGARWTMAGEDGEGDDAGSSIPASPEVWGRILAAAMSQMASQHA